MAQTEHNTMMIEERKGEKLTSPAKDKPGNEAETPTHRRATNMARETTTQHRKAMAKAMQAMAKAISTQLGQSSNHILASFIPPLYLLAQHS